MQALATALRLMALLPILAVLVGCLPDRPAREDTEGEDTLDTLASVADTLDDGATTQDVPIPDSDGGLTGDVVVAIDMPEDVPSIDSKDVSVDGSDGGTLDACTLDCDDGNPCTDDSVGPGCTCQYANNSNQEPCSDDLCVESSWCDDGVCATVTKQCTNDDGNECTLDACNPDTGDCSNMPVDNGTACSGGVCTDGTCTVCSPDCAGKECGSDGCGGTCGQCPENELCMEVSGTCTQGGMAYVAGGTFLMGQPEDEAGDATETPHTVLLAPYLIDVTEVTNAAYLECVLQGPCVGPTSCTDGNAIWTTGLDYPDELAAHPVVCVPWSMAKVYCETNVKRLCTEAEWEMACVGGEHRIYPWGNDPGWPEQDADQYANCQSGYCAESVDYTAAVGSFPLGATAETGLVDMAGNVGEWVSDWYTPDYYDQAEAYDNPKGPCPDAMSCATPHKVQRGGSFKSTTEDLQCGARGTQDASLPVTYVGFRCCKDAD